VNETSKSYIESKTDLKSIIKIADLTQVVQELIDSGLVIFNKGIQGHHCIVCLDMTVYSPYSGAS